MFSRGRRLRVPPPFEDEAALVELVHWYTDGTPSARLDRASPTVTMTLPEGSRLHAALSPPARPMTVTIRRAPPARFPPSARWRGRLPARRADSVPGGGGRGTFEYLVAGGAGAGKTMFGACSRGCHAGGPRRDHRGPGRAHFGYSCPTASRSKVVRRTRRARAPSPSRCSSTKRCACRRIASSSVRFAAGRRSTAGCNAPGHLIPCTIPRTALVRPRRGATRPRCAIPRASREGARQLVSTSSLSIGFRAEPTASSRRLLMGCVGGPTRASHVQELLAPGDGPMAPGRVGDAGAGEDRQPGCPTRPVARRLRCLTGCRDLRRRGLDGGPSVAPAALADADGLLIFRRLASSIWMGESALLPARWPWLGRSFAVDRRAPAPPGAAIAFLRQGCRPPGRRAAGSIALVRVAGSCSHALRIERQDAVLEAVRMLRQLLTGGHGAPGDRNSRERGPVLLPGVPAHRATSLGRRRCGRWRAIASRSRSSTCSQPRSDSGAGRRRLAPLFPSSGDGDQRVRGGARAEALQVQARSAAAITVSLPIVFLLIPSTFAPHISTRSVPFRSTVLAGDAHRQGASYFPDAASSPP